MLTKIIEQIIVFIHKASEWIVAGVSFLIYQLGIPLEIHALNINPYVASLLHGIVSMMVPVGSYFIIHISKELLKDPDSWLSIAFRKCVYISSFKWIKNHD